MNVVQRSYRLPSTLLICYNERCFNKFIIKIVWMVLDNYFVMWIKQQDVQDKITVVNHTENIYHIMK